MGLEALFIDEVGNLLPTPRCGRRRAARRAADTRFHHNGEFVPTPLDRR